MMVPYREHLALDLEVAGAANPFDRLPNEIITKILGLDEHYGVIMDPDWATTEDLRRLRATCKLFRSLVIEAGVLRWIFKEDGSVTRFNRFISSNPAAKLKRVWLLVQRDYLLDLNSLLPSAFSPIVETLEFVTILFNLRDRTSDQVLESDISFEAFQSCKKLRHLEIRPGCYDLDSWRAVDFLKEPLPKLAVLKMSNLSMRATELQAMLPQFPILQYLSVSFERPDTSLSSDCIIESSTLKTLKWYEEGGTKTLEITCPRLKELSISTEAQVSISCPFMEKLDASRPPEIDALAAMSFLTDLSFYEATWSTALSLRFWKLRPTQGD